MEIKSTQMVTTLSCLVLLVNQLFLLTQITFCLILITGVESGEGLAPPQEKNFKKTTIYVDTI